MRTLVVSDEVWLELAKLKVELKEELQKRGKKKASFNSVIEYLIELYKNYTKKPS
jgi:hypothetical protein